MLNTHDCTTPKEYLNRAFLLDTLINIKLEQLDGLRAIATKVTAHITDMPKSSTPNKQAMENTVIKLVDLEREINADIDALVDTKRDITETIKAVPSQELRALLEMRYLCFRKWTDISDELDKEERSLYHLHGKALECVRRIIFPAV